MFNPHDNPLLGVKVKEPENLYLGSKVAYYLVNGTLEGWKRPTEVERMKTRQKRENHRYDF